MLSNRRTPFRNPLRVLLLAIVAVTACEGSKTMEVETDAPRTRISSDKSSTQPPGSASYTAFKTVTEERLGVRIYPGAKPRNGGSWQMTDRLDEGAQSLMMATLHSDDTLDKVADFYTRELGVPPAHVLRVPTRNGPKISITAENGDRGATNVMLQRAGEESGTLIKITRMKGLTVPHTEHLTNH